MTSVHSPDDDETFVSTSAAFDAQLGYAGADLVGVKFRDLVAEDDRHRIAAHRDLEKEHGKAVPLVVFVRCASGDLMRVMARMDPVAGHKVCTIIPLNDSTHYSVDDVAMSKDLLTMAKSARGGPKRPTP